MSTFFKALERAEQERALRQPTPSPAPATGSAPAEPAPTPPAAADSLRPVSAPAARSVFTPPRPPAAPRPGVAPGLEDHERGLEEHLVSLLAPTSFAAEQYRALRHVVEQLHRTTDLSVIAVSSPDAGDGKTTTAINLAGALAQASDTRVLLVDADFRGANMATHLGLDEHAAPGLVEAILDPKLTLEAVVQVRPDLNLSILPAGRRPSAPYEVLKSARAAELLAEARAKYDYVIVDTPPLVSVPDTRITGKSVDGFLIVVAANRTPRRLLEEALNLMEPAKILGMVFNGDDRHLSRETSSSRRRSVILSRTSARRIAPDR
jgi:capsular exopolysaccharide synthesis family protein